MWSPCENLTSTPFLPPVHDDALAGGADLRFADRLVTSGFTDAISDDFMAAAIEYADRIRRAGGNIDGHTEAKTSMPERSL
jgi:hypothetical protein